MFKLYKKLRPFDWVLIAVLAALTVLQVYCTMELVDFMQDIIRSITYLNYRNNPSEIGFAEIVEVYGWNFDAELLAQIGIEGEAASTLLKISSARVGDIWYNGGMMLLVAAASALAQTLVGFIAAYVASGLSANIRSAVYAKVDAFSVAETNKFSTPSLITRTTNDVQQVQIANILMLRMAFAAPVTAVWAICKIQATSAQLTLATAVTVIVLVLFLGALMLFVLPKFRIMQKLLDRLNCVSRENLTGIRVIRAYNAEGYQQEKFSKANEDITKTQLFTGRLMSLMMPVMMLIMNGISLVIYWLGASLINKGQTDYATVAAFMQLASQIIMAFMMLVMMFVLMPRAQVSAKRINEVLEAPLSVTDPETDAARTEEGSVEFIDVSFGYPDAEEKVIHGVSFKAAKGETVAFIGSTGSGKSTLVNLAARFFDVSEGRILIDGVDVRAIKQATLHRLIGYVPQKGVLFSGSVRDNIAFGNPDLSDEDIISAAKAAEAHGFISEMENGYLSEISQGGKNVSGGQKQRISIARAVAVKPEIFIFDDSFSALDYKTDRQVRENLKSACAGATKLIVAQRIGTVMDADKIVVLDGGRTVGIGTHAELLKTCPVYREIALSQLSKEELGL